MDIGFVELELKLPIAFEYEKFKNILKPPYGVLNLGASDDSRVYKRFDEMIYFLNPDYQLVLCGNSKKDERACQFHSKTPQKCHFFSQSNRFDRIPLSFKER